MPVISAPAAKEHPLTRLGVFRRNCLATTSVRCHHERPSHMANRHNEPLSPQFLRDFLHQMKDAGNSRDVDRVVALCTEDIILDDLTESDVLKGRDEVREFLQGIYGALPDDFAFEVIGEPYLTLDGWGAAARWRGVGTRRSSLPSGSAEERVLFDSAEFYEFRERLLSKWILVFRDRNWMDRLG